MGVESGTARVEPACTSPCRCDTCTLFCLLDTLLVHLGDHAAPVLQLYLSGGRLAVATHFGRPSLEPAGSWLSQPLFREVGERHNLHLAVDAVGCLDGANLNPLRGPWLGGAAWTAGTHPASRLLRCCCRCRHGVGMVLARMEAQAHCSRIVPVGAACQPRKCKRLIWFGCAGEHPIEAANQCTCRHRSYHAFLPCKLINAPKYDANSGCPFASRIAIFSQRKRHLVETLDSICMHVIFSSNGLDTLERTLKVTA